MRKKRKRKGDILNVGSCGPHLSFPWTKFWAGEGGKRTLFSFTFGGPRVKEMNATLFVFYFCFLIWDMFVPIEASLSHDNPSNQRQLNTAAWTDRSECTPSESSLTPVKSANSFLAGKEWLD